MLGGSPGRFPFLRHSPSLRRKRSAAAFVAFLSFRGVHSPVVGGQGTGDRAGGVGYSPGTSLSSWASGGASTPF
jgi:hypothetical protein